MWREINIFSARPLEKHKEYKQTTMLQRSLYRQLLRHTKVLSKATKDAPRAQLVFRGSIYPQITPSAHQQFQNKMDKWQTEIINSTNSTNSNNTINPINDIQHLIRTAFEQPTDNSDTILTNTLSAIRDLSTTTSKLKDSRAWHTFANASVTTEHTTVLDAASTRGGMCKIEHIVNAHLVEYGLSLIAGLRNSNSTSCSHDNEANNKTTQDILKETSNFLDTVATMGSLLLKHQIKDTTPMETEPDPDSELSKLRIKKQEENIIQALNQVFFQQHQMTVVIDTETENSIDKELSTETLQEEQPTMIMTMDSDLYFVDKAIETSRGAPLVIGGLYTAALSRMGMAAQVLQVPNTNQVLVIGAASLGNFLEKRCYVIDVASDGAFENVPIAQLENALQTMIQRSNPDARLCNNCERNLTASNLLRSVDLCINLSQRLVFTLSHLEAHRVEAVESDGNEALRRSFVDLITDLTGAVESGDYSVDVFEQSEM